MPALRPADPQDPRGPERNALLPELHPTSLKFRDRARDAGLDVEVRELSESTRTAVEAADAVGCDLGQIVKSVVLIDGDEPVLCLCAGDRRVGLDRIGDHVRMARGKDVKELTGYAIGGVPPLGHDRPLRTVVDRSLTRFDTVWCAAGTPNSLFGAPLDDLLHAIGDAELADVAEGA